MKCYQSVGQQSTGVDCASFVRKVLVCIICLAFCLTQQSISGATDDSTNDQYFKVKPKDVEVIEGDDAELECQISGDPGVGAIRAKVQWAKDGFLL
ncbi:unnamed protein product, partial [Oppiella nova]